MEFSKQNAVLVLYGVTAVASTSYGLWRYDHYSDDCWTPDVIDPFSAASSLLYLIASTYGSLTSVALAGSVLSASSMIMHAIDAGDSKTMDHLFASLLGPIVLLEYISFYPELGISILAFFFTVAAVNDIGWMQWFAIGVVAFLLLISLFLWKKMDAKIPLQISGFVALVASSAVLKYYKEYDFCDKKRDAVHSLWHFTTSSLLLLSIDTFLGSRTLKWYLIGGMVLFSVVAIVVTMVDSANYLACAIPQIVYGLLFLVPSMHHEKYILLQL